jgi:hypothetical protein
MVMDGLPRRTESPLSLPVIPNFDRIPAFGWWSSGFPASMGRDVASRERAVKAIEHIVMGYSTLKNRAALEEIRLDQYQMRDRSVLRFDRIEDDLRDEIEIVETALSKLHDGNGGRLSTSN